MTENFLLNGSEVPGEIMTGTLNGEKIVSCGMILEPHEVIVESGDELFEFPDKVSDEFSSSCIEDSERELEK